MSDKTALNLKVIVDDVLTYLEASEETNARVPKSISNSKNNNKRHAIAPVAFDGVVPLGMNDDDDETILYETDSMDSASKLPIWPLDVSFCSWQETPVPGMNFQRFRTIKPKEARGLVKLVSPVMAEQLSALVLNDGERLAARGFMSLVGGNWIDARGTIQQWRYGGGFEQHNKYDDTEIEQNRLLPMLATWVALRQRYDWSILLGYEGIARVRFFTDPIGLRAVFKLRDLPPGKERRAALKHWVRQHWRRQRDDEEARSWVRRHIRGAESFTWDGLRCAIRPAEFDLEQIAKGAA